MLESHYVYLFCSIDYNWSESAVASHSLEAEWPHTHAAVPSLTPVDTWSLTVTQTGIFTDLTRLVGFWHLSEGLLATCPSAAY